MSDDQQKTFDWVRYQANHTESAVWDRVSWNWARDLVLLQVGAEVTSRLSDQLKDQLHEELNDEQQ